ncbi:MAG TPA: DUF3368 domain-containing protein [Gammaproteobacteria bacterium]|nr:DUF3368 domain-containing protein [Gammaproteobacteria bacterium]
MSRIIVCDTTTLIVLEKQRRLALLCELFNEVIIPENVFHEFQAGLVDDQSLADAGCLSVVKVASSSRLNSLLILLDAGEAEAIELAASEQLPLIIDEKKGRSIAQRLGLVITGLAGLLVLAAKENILKSAQAQDILDNAVQHGYRLSPGLYKQITDQLK